MNSYININIKAKDSIILTPQPETLTQVPGAPRWFILRVWFPLDLLRRGLPNPVQLSGSFHPDLFLLSPEPALSPATVYRLPPIHPTWRLGRHLDLGYPVIRLLTSPWSPPRSFPSSSRPFHFHCSCCFENIDVCVDSFHFHRLLCLCGHFLTCYYLPNGSGLCCPVKIKTLLPEELNYVEKQVLIRREISPESVSKTPQLSLKCLDELL